MDVLQPTAPDAQANSSQAPDPRLQPTPDYGTLGPGSDIAGYGPAPQQPARKGSPEILRLIAFGIGISAALLAGAVRKIVPAHSGSETVFSSQQKRPATAKDMSQLDHMRPQKQAETLLELAVAQTAGANEQIASRVDGWHGRVRWNPQIASLSTAAL